MNKYLSVMMLALSCLSAGASAEQYTPQKSRERICYQTFGGSIIPISCQNVQSILEGKEIYPIPTIKEGPYKGLSQITDRDGNLVIGIVSGGTRLYHKLEQVGFKRPDYDTDM